MTILSPADLERLRTWAVEITEVLLGTAHRTEGHETVFSKSGGLHIRDDGAWYVHAAQCGHWNAVLLIQRLKGCSLEEAEQWADAWLASHPGVGRTSAQKSDTEDAGLELADYARELLDRALEPAGNVAEVYLRDIRKVDPPYPDCVKFVPDVRAGEHGILGILTARGRIVGVQLGFLTPDGSKSLVLPNRRSYRLEQDGYLEGTFAVQVPGETPSLSKSRPTLVVAEGLENALSITASTMAPWVVGIPGIGRLRHLPVNRGDKIVVFRDGDPVGSPADKALVAGADALLLTGAEVRVTATPAGEDANSILQKYGSGDVAQLLRDASAAHSPSARLSRDGEIIRLSRLSPLDYDLERRSAATKLGLRTETLDEEVKRVRGSGAAASGKSTGTSSASSTPEEAPWDDEINLRAALDAGLKELTRYVVAKETTLAIAIIWPVHAHLLGNKMVNLQRSPRLKIESRTPGCGKTTLLEAVIALSPEGRILSGYSASSVMRSIAKRHPTLGLDEGDRGIVGNNDLVQIIDAGDRRHTALVTRSIKLPDGNWGEEELDVFGAMAIAAIDTLPGTAEDRCVRVFLQKARTGEINDTLHDGTSLELVNVRRHVAAWAAAQTELPEPKLPEELMKQAPRTVSNWRILVAIADAAGGRWPALIRQAVLEEISAEREPSLLEQLLRGIRAALDAQSDVAPGDRRAADDKDRIQTKTLLGFLLQDASEEWNRANRGRAITAHFLREKLRGLLKPPGAQDWWTGPKTNRTHHSGYERYQLEDTWARYLASHVPPPVVSRASGAPGGSTAPDEKMAESRHSGGAPGPSGIAPDHLDQVHQPADRVHEKSASEAGSSVDASDPPGAPDAAETLGQGEEEDAAASAPNTDVIRKARIQNPKWGRRRLAIELGLSEWCVRTALEGWEPPAPPEEPPVAPPEPETA